MLNKLLPAILLPTLWISAAAADTLVVLNKAENTASLISLNTGKEMARLPTGKEPHEVTLSPDGKLAVIADYESGPYAVLTVLNIETASVVSTIPLGKVSNPHGIKWIPGTREVVVTCETNKKVLRVDVNAGKVIAVIPTHQKTSHLMVLNAAGTIAYVSNLDSDSVTVLDLTKNTKITDVKTGEGTEGLDLSPDGSQVWVTNTRANTVSIIDTATLKVVAEVPSGGKFPIRVKFTLDGQRALVTNAETGALNIFDVASRKSVGSVQFTAPDGGKGTTYPIGILIDPVRNQAYVAHSNVDMISVVSLNNLSVTSTIIPGKEPDGMAYSPIDVQATPLKQQAR